MFTPVRLCRFKNQGNREVGLKLKQPGKSCSSRFVEASTGRRMQTYLMVKQEAFPKPLLPAPFSVEDA
jgi:hypothetical protein